MDRYLSKDTDVTHYHVVIGHKTKNIIHPKLLQPRCQARDKNGAPVMGAGDYFKSFVMDDEQLRENPVYSWSSDNVCLCSLPNPEKNTVNSIKTFLNHSEDYQTAVVFHDKSCSEEGKRGYAYGNHLHVLLKTELEQMYSHKLYRNMKRAVDKLNGYCKLSEITGDVMTFLHYLSGDDEKTFLGAKSQELLTMYLESENITGALKPYFQRDVDEPLNAKKSMASYKWSLENDQTDAGPSQSRNLLPLDVETQVIPDNLRRDNSGKSVKYLLGLLKEHPKCRDISQLVSALTPFSEEWSAVVHCATTPGGKAAFNLALSQFIAELTDMTVAELVLQSEDNLDGYMSPRQSQAMFNAWCFEQNIKPKMYCAVMQMLLSGKGQKRIGVYLHGQPNSGKTVMTNTMWTAFRDVVGVLTRDNFILQDCGGKKIVVGEEVAITPANLERFKDLMSGAIVKCERKCLAPVDCKPYMVFMNSNRTYSSQLDSQGAVAIKCRIYAFENLKRSKIMTSSSMLGYMHPKMFFDGMTPFTEDDFACLRSNLDIWNFEPCGHGEVYSGSWDEIGHSIQDYSDPKHAANRMQSEEVHPQSVEADTGESDPVETGSQSSEFRFDVNDDLSDRYQNQEFRCRESGELVLCVGYIHKDRDAPATGDLYTTVIPIGDDGDLIHSATREERLSDFIDEFDFVRNRYPADSGSDQEVEQTSVRSNVAIQDSPPLSPPRSGSQVTQPPRSPRKRKNSRSPGGASNRSSSGSSGRTVRVSSQSPRANRPTPSLNARLASPLVLAGSGGNSGQHSPRSPLADRVSDSDSEHSNQFYVLGQPPEFDQVVPNWRVEDVIPAPRSISFSSDSGFDEDNTNYSDREIAVVARNFVIDDYDVMITLNNFYNMLCVRSFTELRMNLGSQFLSYTLVMWTENTSNGYPKEEKDPQLNNTWMPEDPDEWDAVETDPDDKTYIQPGASPTHFSKVNVVTVKGDECLQLRLRPIWIGENVVRKLTLFTESEDPKLDVCMAVPLCVPIYPSCNDVDIELSIYKVLTFAQMFMFMTGLCRVSFPALSHPLISLQCMYEELSMMCLEDYPPSHRQRYLQFLKIKHIMEVF